MDGSILLADIGAANFQIEDRWLFLREDVEPVLFEPDKRSYSKLLDSGAQVYNAALGADDTSIQFYLTRKPECSSFYKPNIKLLSKYPNSERWDILKSEIINTKKLDSFNLDLDFLKIDTQGSELDILRGSNITLKSVLGLELEVSFLEIYENQPLFGQVCDYLSAKDFEFFDFITEYRYGRYSLNRKGQLAFADALFLRTPEYVNNFFSREKKLKYMSIAKAYNKEDLSRCIIL